MIRHAVYLEIRSVFGLIIDLSILFEAQEFSIRVFQGVSLPCNEIDLELDSGLGFTQFTLFADKLAVESARYLESAFGCRVNDPALILAVVF